MSLAEQNIEEPSVVNTDEFTEEELGVVTIAPDLENNRADERQLILKAHRARLIQSIHALEVNNRVSIPVPGEEGIGSAIVNGIASLGNIVGHMVKLFTTFAFDGWRDFKRSELVAMYDSNTVSYRRVFAQTGGVPKDHRIPVPQGMEGTYRNAIDLLDDFLKTLDMYARVRTMKSVCESIEKSLKNKDNTFVRHVAETNRTFLPKEVAQLFGKSAKIFTGKSHGYSVFHNGFEDMADVQYCVTKVMSMDTYLKQLASIHALLQDIEAITDRIIQNATYLNKAQVADLAKVMRMFAETFDMYATVINDVSRVNHNLVFVMTGLRKYFNV